jgi:hypothetical protein
MDVPDGDENKLAESLRELIQMQLQSIEQMTLVQLQLRAWTVIHRQIDLAQAAGISAQYLSDLVHSRRTLNFEVAGRLLAGLEQLNG